MTGQLLPGRFLFATSKEALQEGRCDQS